jgi:hypothetical protein
MPISTRLPELEHWKAQVKCQSGCPVATDAGRYVQLIAEGRDEEAFLVARAPNPFASVCGRVCAAPCEDACRRGAIDAPIAIRALKRYVTERYGVESVRPDTQNRLRNVPTPEGNRYAGHLPIDTGAARPGVVGKRVEVVGASEDPSGEVALAEVPRPTGERLGNQELEKRAEALGSDEVGDDGTQHPKATVVGTSHLAHLLSRPFYGHQSFRIGRAQIGCGGIPAHRD